MGKEGELGGLPLPGGGPLGHFEPRVWERVIEINLTANWRLIRSMDALLRASPAGRALFVTSGVASRVHPYWGAYAASKAGLEMLARTYAAEAAKSALKVNIVDPGQVRTAMRAQAMPGEDPASLPPPEAITDTFVDLASAECTLTGEIVHANS